jgi:hypothetical protein
VDVCVEKEKPIYPDKVTPRIVGGKRKAPPNPVKRCCGYGPYGSGFQDTLEYWMLSRVALDVMHMCKNLLLCILLTISGRREPDSDRDGLEEERAKHANMSATDEMLNVADARYVSIQGPRGWISKCRPPFARTSGLTAADCHHILAFMLPYLLFGVVDENVYDVIITFASAVAQLIDREIVTAHLDRMEDELRESLEKFHELLPETEHRVNLHAFSHLPALVKQWGVTQATNMFPFERSRMHCMYVNSSMHVNR